MNRIQPYWIHSVGARCFSLISTRIGFRWCMRFYFHFVDSALAVPQKETRRCAQREKTKLRLAHKRCVCVCYCHCYCLGLSRTLLFCCPIFVVAAVIFYVCRRYICATFIIQVILYYVSPHRDDGDDRRRLHLFSVPIYPVEKHMLLIRNYVEETISSFVVVLLFAVVPGCWCCGYTISQLLMLCVRFWCSFFFSFFWTHIESIYAINRVNSAHDKMRMNCVA